MAKKQMMINEADQLTEEEAAAEAEMMEDDDAEVVAVEEAAGDEKLSDEDVVGEPAKPAAKPETTVPLQALDSERAKRKEVEARMAVVEEQLRRITASKEDPPAPAVPVERPDPVLNPEAFWDHFDKTLEQRSQPMQQIQQQMQFQNAVNGLVSYAQKSEAEFKAEAPDFGDALEYARDMKARELRNFGYSEEEIPAQVSQLEAYIALAAAQRGVNPAKIVYEYAKLTGYKGKSESDAGEKIIKLAGAQKATASTASAAGSARSEEYTIESLSGMSEKELAKVPDEVLAKVLGA